MRTPDKRVERPQPLSSVTVSALNCWRIWLPSGRIENARPCQPKCPPCSHNNESEGQLNCSRSIRWRSGKNDSSPEPGALSTCTIGRSPTISKLAPCSETVVFELASSARRVVVWSRPGLGEKVYSGHSDV